MEMISRVTLAIRLRSADQSEVGNARRQALALASALDFTETRCGELGIVVTEAARNLAVHGGGGEILLTPWQTDSVSGVDVLALDQGRGISDISKALQDGYSTSGTPGTGLGAIERLAHHFELYSQPASQGTVVLARLLSAPAMDERPVPLAGSVQVPVAGETVSGDAWCASFESERTVYLMADGLGHGPAANQAATEAVLTFRQTASQSIRDILQNIHRALPKTRGAAVGIAEIDTATKMMNYVGAGNIATSLCGAGKSRSMVSMNGTPGHNMGAPREFTYPLADDRLMVMHSDGVLTRWNLTDYPGLASRHPALIAGVLYRDFTRKRDDATILVAAVA